jgi:hypothetical protein
MVHFKNVSTIDEVKALYKQLAKQFHPDCGGDTATMQEINTEYAFACAKILKGENLSADETNEQIRLSEEYRKVIEQIINLPNIVIEVMGNWIWVTGNTYPSRKELRAAGLYFASKKTAWYYRAEEFRTRTGNKPLEEIRKKYGSERVNFSGGRKAIK